MACPNDASVALIKDELLDIYLLDFVSEKSMVKIGLCYHLNVHHYDTSHAVFLHYGINIFS
jgi:uncharacterized radical SAM superfamily protein